MGLIFSEEAFELHLDSKGRNMTNTNTLLSRITDITDAFRDLNFENPSEIFSNPKLAKDIKAAADVAFSDPFDYIDLVQVPANIWFENGNKHIEVAIPGKTKDMVKVSMTSLSNHRFLLIEATSPELTEEQKAAEAKREYKMRKIRGLTSMKFKVPLEENLDVSSLVAKVENGLLSIVISALPEDVQLREFEIL